MTFMQKVAARKAAKRGMSRGAPLIQQNPAAVAYAAADLHNRPSAKTSAGQAPVPDWNPGSSYFSPKLR